MNLLPLWFLLRMFRHVKSFTARVGNGAAQPAACCLRPRSATKAAKVFPQAVVVLLVVSHFGPDDCAPPLPFSDLAMQLQLLLSYLWWPCTSVYRLSVYLSLSITAYSDDTKRVGYSKEVD